MAKKKPGKSTRLAKEARRRKRQIGNVSAARSATQLGGRTAGATGRTIGLTMPGASEPWGVVDLAPTMTVTEFTRRTAAGETITGHDVDLTDPPLGVALSRRGGKWVDGGDPPNSLWDLVGSATAEEEYAQPLYISVGIHDGRPRWAVAYPSTDESDRGYDEVFTTRDELVAALDRLERYSVA
ncbi:hypothetical protein [Gordonia sputi]